MNDSLPRSYDSSRRLLDVNMVLALNHAARIVPSSYVTEPYVARQAAEERNAVSNEHRHASDNETLNQMYVFVADGLRPIYCGLYPGGRMLSGTAESSIK